MAAAIDAAEAARPHSGRTVTADLTPQPDEDRPGRADRRHAGLRQYHPGSADSGQRRRRARRLGDKPARPSDVGALARHHAAQRHGRRRARHPEHRSRPEFTYRFSVPDPGTYWAHPHTGLDRRHRPVSAVHRRRSDRIGPLRRRMDRRPRRLDRRGREDPRSSSTKS